MSNAPKIVDSYDPHSKSDVVPQKSSQFLTKSPEELVFKLVKFSREKTYVLMDYFNHQVGPNQKDTRNHVCLVSLGDTESPEKDVFFDAVKKLKELKATGGSKAELARYEETKIKFKATTRAWLCIVTPGNSKLQALRVPRSVVDDIFGVDGRYSNDYRPARVGVLNEMMSNGRSPFDLKSETGWLKLVKTGSGIATRYSLKEHEHQTTEVDGNKKVTYSEPAKFPVNPQWLELTMDDVPNVYEFERKFAFNLEEAKKFVESNASEIPERFLKKSKTSEKSETLANLPSSTDFSAVSDDDEELPF